jgi:hypothetical protein
MKYIKLFEQFITESNSDNIVDKILTALADDIQTLIGKHEEAFEKHFERPMTDYDKELTRLNIIWDMVKAIETYTLPTDNLITISSYSSPKGNLTISAQIERDDTVYNFNTEVIYAGGYNIQRLHYRYITKTNIPKTGNTTISSQYQEKIKKLSKLEKLNKEIESYEIRIKRTEEKIEVNSKLTDEEILNVLKSGKDWYEWPTWSEIVKRGADKNYDNDENVFNQKREEHIQFKIKFWKDMNVDSQRKYLADYQRTVNKLNAKLKQMM